MKKQLLFDLKAWLLALILMPLGIHMPDFTSRILVSLGVWVLLILGFYPHQWLIRRYAKARKWAAYVAGLALLLCSMALLIQYSINILDAKEGISFPEALLNVAFMLFFSTAISMGYRGIWLQIQYEKARRRQVEAELNLLQSQVNPHFLFNTLNNIYAQNLSDSAAANDMILQLADLMRYQTESSRKSRVKLEEEIQFLRNYIALESSRLPPNAELVFKADTPGDVSLYLPPMLFVPFVENAFKHGIGAEAGCFVRIHLSVREKDLIFELENSIPQLKRSMPSTQIGLSNLKKRLEILFPDQYQLRVDNNGQIYRSSLSIPLLNRPAFTLNQW